MRPCRLLACLLPLMLAAPGLAAAQGDTFEETAALQPGGSLAIEASGGSVLLLAWDRPQVEIQARIEAPADVDGDYARDIVAATRIDVRATAGAVRVRSDFSDVERGFFDRGERLADSAVAEAREMAALLEDVERWGRRSA